MTERGTPLEPDWVAVHACGSKLRLWLMAANGMMLDQRSSNLAGDALAPEQIKAPLYAMVQDIPGDAPLPMVICGVAGSGDAPFLTAPCPPPTCVQATRIEAGRIKAHILPGVTQHAPADFMQGDETMIAGFLTTQPDFDGVLCITDRHTRWVHISAGEIVSFRSFMTEELFSVISTHTILKKTLNTPEWHQEAFDVALSDTMARPAELAAKLFGLHADAELNKLPPGTAPARLAAILIGAELAATKPYWLGQQVVILGQGTMATAYDSALRAQGVDVQAIENKDMILKGLKAAYAGLASYS